MENIDTEKISISFQEMKTTKTENDFILDIRSPELFHLQTIPGAVNIPLDQISRLYDLPHTGRIFVLCQEGEQSEEIAELLRDADYTAYSLEGGFRQYIRLLARQTMSGA